MTKSIAPSLLQMSGRVGDWRKLWAVASDILTFKIYNKEQSHCEPAEDFVWTTVFHFLNHSWAHAELD